MTEGSFKPRAIKVEQWPAAHQQAWKIATTPGSVFDKKTATLRRREPTNKLTRETYGIFLSYLLAKGADIETTTPRECLTKENVKDFLCEIDVINSSYTISIRCQQLYSAARIMEPDLDWTWLLNAYKKKRSAARPSRNKSENLQSLEDILHLGRRLMRLAQAADEETPTHSQRMTPLQRALCFRDGLMIFLMAQRPLRISNFHQIRINTNLIIRPTSMVLAFGGADMKSKRPLECVLSEECAAAIKTYLKTHRDILLRASTKAKHITTDALWISRDGTELKIGPLYIAIKKRTGLAFSRHMWPHLFRDAVATLVTTKAPHLANKIPDLLGHNSVAIFEKHYDHAPMSNFSLKHAQWIEKLKKISGAQG